MRDGAGVSQRLREPAGRWPDCGRACHPGLLVTWPGLIPRCPALSSHALVPGGRAVPRPELRPCSDPRTRPFQIVQTRATHSVRLSLGPTPGSLSDPTVRDAGPMMGLMAGGGRVVTASAPVRTWPWPMGLACTCCVLYRVLCTVMSRGTGRRHTVSRLHHRDRTLTAPSRVPPGDPV